MRNIALGLVHGTVDGTEVLLLVRPYRMLSLSCLLRNQQLSPTKINSWHNIFFVFLQDYVIE